MGRLGYLMGYLIQALENFVVPSPSSAHAGLVHGGYRTPYSQQGKPSFPSTLRFVFFFPSNFNDRVILTMGLASIKAEKIDRATMKSLVCRGEP